MEALNEKRSGVVQMVKLAEKEKDSLEVLKKKMTACFIFWNGHCLSVLTIVYHVFSQNVKNEAEAYMLKELSLLKWQEKATNLASEDNATKILELQTNVSNLEENLKTER